MTTAYRWGRAVVIVGACLGGLVGGLAVAWKQDRVNV